MKTLRCENMERTFTMQENKSLNEQQEQVIIIPPTRIIEINSSRPQRAYGLFDPQTGTQVSDFVRGTGDQITFKPIQPNRHYDVGIIENPGDEKPQFAINWTRIMKDNTEDALKNSGNLPVVYPNIYEITDNGVNSNGIHNLANEKGETVGQVINLSQTGDKPRFNCVQSFKMVDDSKE